jgi:uncharacterized protein
MLQWFRWLMPRQEMFFPLFARHAEVVLSGARELRQMLDGGPQVGQFCKRLIQQEHRADGIAREVLVGIRTTFITPFDRADIRHLITAMDDTIDQMHQTAKTIVLFEVSDFAPEMRAIADAIVECAELVRKATALLPDVARNASKLTAICVQITQAEERADGIHDEGLKKLYLQTKSGDPMDFVRGIQIYEHLEECVDRFDDVGNEIQGIVTEHV